MKYRVLSFFGQSRLLRASGQSEQNVDAPVLQRSQAQLSFGGPGPEPERTEERSSWGDSILIEWILSYGEIFAKRLEEADVSFS